MMYTIRVSDGVDKVIAKWKKSNPNLFKKYKKIYKELLEHPKTGLGHPEALRGGGDITWSRHITAHDRIIYDIYEEVVEVYILEVEGLTTINDKTVMVEYCVYWLENGEPMHEVFSSLAAAEMYSCAIRGKENIEWVEVSEEETIDLDELEDMFPDDFCGV